MSASFVSLYKMELIICESVWEVTSLTKWARSPSAEIFQLTMLSQDTKWPTCVCMLSINKGKGHGSRIYTLGSGSQRLLAELVLELTTNNLFLDGSLFHRKWGQRPSVQGLLSSFLYSYRHDLKVARVKENSVILSCFCIVVKKNIILSKTLISLQVDNILVLLYSWCDANPSKI